MAETYESLLKELIDYEKIDKLECFYASECDDEENRIVCTPTGTEEKHATW